MELGIQKSSATQTENVEENLLQRGSFQPERKEKIIILIEDCQFKQQGTRVNATWQLQFSTVFTDEKLSPGCIMQFCALAYFEIEKIVHRPKTQIFFQQNTKTEDTESF